MNNINKYTLEDFVQDLSFRRWASGKYLLEDCIWDEWLEQNPEKRMMVEEAKSLVIASQIEEIAIPNPNIDREIQQILLKTKKKPVYQALWFKVAASVAIVLGLALFYFSQTEDEIQKPAIVMSSETDNKSSEPLTLKLSDGSMVTLKKGSRLQVAVNFGVENRTVYLTGEAFFNIQKDTQRPFLVYAGGIVTKVLGTSFSIRAYNNETKTSVQVKSGHVTVYRQERAENGQSPNQMLLTPNQQVIFERNEEKLIKTLVDKPIILVHSEKTIQFEYDETPISKVFMELEKVYGVKIIFDNDLLDKCAFTAVFTGKEPLLEKIGIICETIQARYEIVDGQIVIYAKGCR